MSAGTSTNPMASLEGTYRQSVLGPLDLEPYRDPALVVPLLAVVASELFLFAGHTNLALWGHFLALLACALGPLVVDDVELLQVFALVPVFRLVNLGMPVFVELTLLWFPLVYAPLVPAMVLVARRQGLVTPSLPDRRALLLLPPGVVASAVLAEIEYTIIRPDALIPTWSVPQLLLISLVMICFVGFVEEFVYRGALQRALQRRVGPLGGLVVASALFGLMHSAYGLPGEIAFAAGIGLLFGLLYDATDSLLVIAVVHGTLNVFLFAVIPIHGALFGIA